MAEADGAAPADQRRGYVICTTQRTGSNYLCQLLSATGVLGRPLDYFNSQGLKAKGRSDYPSDPNLQLAIIKEEAATANGVYGFKLFGHQVERLACTDWANQLPNLQWIFLTRDDLVDQAISLVIAQQTGQWRSGAPMFDQPVYTEDNIELELTEITRTNGLWKAYFSRNGLSPLQITYESLAADPKGVVDAICRFMNVAFESDGAPVVDVGLQRTQLNVQWKERFLKESGNLLRFEPPPEATSDGALAFSPYWHSRLALVESEDREAAEHQAVGLSFCLPSLWFARVADKPRLTVSIQTRNSSDRLESLLAGVADYADEILVGVDASSTDDSFEIASDLADIAYRFALPEAGHLAPARMLPFDLATGDWILSLDDDEAMDGEFKALLPELMAAEGVTHHHFTRKWIIAREPAAYLHSTPWFPNWSRRMIRNDRSIVWKPAQPHTQYMVIGPGHYETRTSILHFEPLQCEPGARRLKLHAYRAAGAHPDSEAFYDYTEASPRRPLQLPPSAATRPRRDPQVLHEAPHLLKIQKYPPWGCAVRRVDISQTAAPGGALLFEATVRNTGALAWAPSFAQWPTQEWPMLRLSYHLLRHNEDLLELDGQRYLINDYVPVGGDITFIGAFTAPDAPGDYIIEWDMVNEGECWFAQCGGQPRRTYLRVGEPGRRRL
jgi:LPS sulfotransferase NodH